MRQPGPSLPAVDAEPIEPPLNVAREPTRAASLVVEDEQAGTSSLAVAHRGEPDLPRPSGRIA
jgi:hypothetical protein